MISLYNKFILAIIHDDKQFIIDNLPNINMCDKPELITIAFNQDDPGINIIMNMVFEFLGPGEGLCERLISNHLLDVNIIAGIIIPLMDNGHITQTPNEILYMYIRGMINKHLGKRFDMSLFNHLLYEFKCHRNYDAGGHEGDKFIKVLDVYFHRFYSDRSLAYFIFEELMKRGFSYKMINLSLGIHQLPAMQHLCEQHQQNKCVKIKPAQSNK